MQCRNLIIRPDAITVARLHDAFLLSLATRYPTLVVVYRASPGAASKIAGCNVEDKRRYKARGVHSCYTRSYTCTRYLYSGPRVHRETGDIASPRLKRGTIAARGAVVAHGNWPTRRRPTIRISEIKSFLFRARDGTRSLSLWGGSRALTPSFDPSPPRISAKPGNGEMNERDSDWSRTSEREALVESGTCSNTTREWEEKRREENGLMIINNFAMHYAYHDVRDVSYIKYRKLLVLYFHD